MNVLIIGGTRFMGPYVVERLVNAGHDVTVFHRGPSSGSLTVPVREVHGDRNRLADFASELRALEPDVVLDMMLVNERQALDLMDAFRGVAGRVVAASSQDVYRAYGRLIRREPGPPDPMPLTEDGPLRERLYPYRSEDPLPEGQPRPWSEDYDKILVERVVMGEPDLPGTVIRLPAVYGPNDGQHRLFPYVKRMDDGRNSILLSEEQASFRWSRGFVEDMAHGLFLAVTDARAAGRIYNLAEENPVTEAEWVRQIGDAAGWNGEIVVRPSEQLPEELRDAETDFRHDLVVDTTRIRSELGYAEVVSRDEALRQSIEWERTSPPAEIDPAQFPYETEDEVLANAPCQ